MIIVLQEFFFAKEHPIFYTENVVVRIKQDTQSYQFDDFRAKDNTILHGISIRPQNANDSAYSKHAKKLVTNDFIAAMHLDFNHNNTDVLENIPADNLVSTWTTGQDRQYGQFLVDESFDPSTSKIKINNAALVTTGSANLDRDIEFTFYFMRKSDPNCFFPNRR